MNGSSLEGRSALVTGGASGIGRAISARLATAGATVTIADLDLDAARAAAADIGATEAVHCDVGDPAACRAAVAGVHARDGGPTSSCSENAGLQHVAPIVEFPDEQWDRIIAVILSAAFHLSKAALPGMFAAGYGRIVNVSSMLGIYAAPFKPAYVAEARAQRAHEGDRARGGRPRCDVQRDLPRLRPDAARGAADRRPGEGARDLGGRGGGEGHDQRARDQADARPSEVAAAAMYLLSDEASFMTGGTLLLDGGWSAR